MPGPCRITQLKPPASDGYTAVQVGFGEIREKTRQPASSGHLANQASELLRHLTDTASTQLKVWNWVNRHGRALWKPVRRSMFSGGQPIGQRLQCLSETPTGFQAAAPMTHGSKNHSPAGSTGAAHHAGPVIRQAGMAGRYEGGKRNHQRGSDDPGGHTSAIWLVVKGSFGQPPAPCFNIRPASGRVGAKTRTEGWQP